VKTAVIGKACYKVCDSFPGLFQSALRIPQMGGGCDAERSFELA
jgi:hypothetical protein